MTRVVKQYYVNASRKQTTNRISEGCKSLKVNEKGDKMKREKKEKVKAIKAERVKKRVRFSIQWKMVLVGLGVVAASKSFRVRTCTGWSAICSFLL